MNHGDSGGGKDKGKMLEDGNNIALKIWDVGKRGVGAGVGGLVICLEYAICIKLW